MSKRKVLLNKINQLGVTEHGEIFKMLVSLNVPYSSNNNGVFFNLTTLPFPVLEKIQDFVEFCCTNIEKLDEYDKKLSQCRIENSINNLQQGGYMFTSSINEPIGPQERWKDLLEKVDKTEAVKGFMDKLHTNLEKQLSKRVETKYTVAKKRLLKKITELEYPDELVREQYT